MGFYSTTVTTDASGDGTNLDALGNPAWNGSFRGLLRGVRITFGASPTAGTDTTLTEISGMTRTIHTFTDVVAAANVFPAAAVQGATDFFMPHYVDSANLKVTVAQGGNGKTVTIGLLIEDC